MASSQASGGGGDADFVFYQRNQETVQGVSETDNKSSDKTMTTATAIMKDRLTWRRRARLVAYLDIIYAAMFAGFCASFLTSVTVHIVTFEDACYSWNYLPNNSSPEFVKAVLCCIWIVLLAGILGKLLVIYTNLNLLQAAIMGQDHREIEKLSWFWRAIAVAGMLTCPVVMGVFGVTVYYISLSVHFLAFIFTALVILTYDCVWRFISYFIVYRFLKAFKLPLPYNLDAIVL